MFLTLIVRAIRATALHRLLELCKTRFQALEVRGLCGLEIGVLSVVL
jgi:hypothetical protein